MTRALLFLVLAGCWRDSAPPQDPTTAPKVATQNQPETDPVPPPRSEPAFTPPPPPPPPPQQQPPPAIATGDLPPECEDYRRAVYDLAKCDKLSPAAQDAFKASFDQVSAQWRQMPPEVRPMLAQSCITATQAMRDTLEKLCP
ncbi:MAG TPA: hypothetical protein VGM88_05435 [Kofleriaceae bacterium]|jgi:hypothetical protein